MIQIYSGLFLAGADFDSISVASALGALQPKTVRRRGDLRPNGRSRSDGSLWFTTEDVIRSSVEDSLDDVFNRLDPVWPALIDLGARFQVDIECYVKLFDGQPDAEPYLGFERRHVSRAADLRASLGIDLYDYRGTGIEPEHEPSDIPAR